MSCIDVTEFSRQRHWTAERSFLSPLIVSAACAYFEKVWGVWRKGWESVGDGCGEVWGSVWGDGTCGKMWGKCGKVCWGVGKGRCGEVWVDVGNCWGRCREVCAGGVGKCVGVGRCKKVLGEMWGCGKVCWGVGGGVEKC